MSQTPQTTELEGDAQPRHPRRFIRLLGTLSLLLICTPLAGAISVHVGKITASMLVFLPLSAVLIAAAAAVSSEPRHARTTLILALACIAVSLPNALTHVMAVSLLQDALVVVFLGYVVMLIVRSLFNRREADLDTIAASLCAYILIGVLYSSLFSCFIEVDPRSFAANNMEMEQMHFGDYRTASALYFSFVTLTTLGYGDITPVAVPARILAVSEAIIGQLFLVVLVARLVGLHIAMEIAEHKSDAKP